MYKGGAYICVIGAGPGLTGAAWFFRCFLVA